MYVLFFLFVIFLGVGAFIIPWVAFGLANRCLNRINNLAHDSLQTISKLEQKLADLDRRLKITEGLRTITEPTPQPKPAPQAQPAPVIVSAKIRREKITSIFHKLARRQADLKMSLAKSRTVRKFRRLRNYDQFLLSTLVAKSEIVSIIPVVPVEDKPFIAQLVSSQEPVLPVPDFEPAAIESFIEKRITEKSPSVPAPKSLPISVQPISVQQPPPKPVREKAVPTAAAYVLDEDYDLKPSSFTGEQAHLDHLELLLGRKVLGWVAAVAMILAAVFLINYTAQHFTLRPVFRVISLFGLSFGLIAAGFRYYLFGWKRFSRMLTSTGIVISFLAGYATYSYYDLLSSTPAFFLMSTVVLGSFLLAYGYRSVLLGVHAILGGLAVPLLVHGSPELYPQLFAYLFLLNLGTVFLLNTLNRLPIGLLAMLGTQLEFFSWYLTVGTVHWDGREFLFSLGLDDPVCIRYILVFQMAFYFLYLIDTSFGTISTRFRTTWDDTVRAILAPMIGFGWIYVLYHQDPVLGGYMGLFAFIGAAWYALVHQLYIAFTRKKLGTPVS